MTQIEELEKEHLVCLLKISLYGLKQSPRQWYKRFDTFILKIGFKRSSYDGCFYYKKLQGSLMMFLVIYVDDMLLACKDKSQIQEVKRILKSEFDMMGLGNARRILDMEIVRNSEDRTLFLSQNGYLEKVLQKFSMENSKLVRIPLAGHFRLSMTQCPQSEVERKEMNSVPYANAIRALMYVMVCS